MDLWRSRSSGVCSRIENDRLPLLKNIFSRSMWMGNRMRTIAVIDDNPSMLKGLDRLLSAHGFRVQTFTSAELFLERFAECKADCLLLDIHLGGISGIDLQRRLTSSGIDLPVIFIAAGSSWQIEAARRAVPTVRVLRKPFSMTTLLAMIRELQKF